MSLLDDLLKIVSGRPERENYKGTVVRTEEERLYIMVHDQVQLVRKTNSDITKYQQGDEVTVVNGILLGKTNRNNTKFVYV